MSAGGGSAQKSPERRLRHDRRFLPHPRRRRAGGLHRRPSGRQRAGCAEARALSASPSTRCTVHSSLGQTGRASCRERVCQTVSLSVVAVSLKKKQKKKYKEHHKYSTNQ